MKFTDCGNLNLRPRETGQCTEIFINDGCADYFTGLYDTEIKVLCTICRCDVIEPENYTYHIFTYSDKDLIDNDLDAFIDAFGIYKRVVSNVSVGENGQASLFTRAYSKMCRCIDSFLERKGEVGSKGKTFLLYNSMDVIVS